MTTAFADTIAMLAHELSYWKDLVKTDRFLKGWMSEDRPTPELHAEVADFLAVDRGPVLDVGSGVVSILRGTVPADKLRACDPLSPLYQCIFDYAAHKTQPPDSYPVEMLPYKAEWGVVHISNALDHCTAPPLAMSSMWRCVRPGGYLIIQGFEEEANAQHGQGMHKWNMTLHTRPDKGDYALSVLGYRGRPVGVWYSDHAYIKPLGNGRNWIIWIKRKSL